MNLFTYNGYKIASRLVNDIGEVAVYDPRGTKNAPALYKTTSLDLAAKFIDAYRAGAHWAVVAALEARP
jgi:hypothetical protein